MFKCTSRVYGELIAANPRFGVYRYMLLQLFIVLMSKSPLVPSPPDQRQYVYHCLMKESQSYYEVKIER